MTIDMPPQIPPAIVEYVNEHNYVPDEAKGAKELSEFINECSETYNGYKIYRLGVIDRLDSGAVGYKYKNCYLLLSDKKETRCATEEEEKDIIYHYPNLSKQYSANIPLDVVKFVRFYGENPKETKDGWAKEAEYIIQVTDYYDRKPVIYKGHTIYFLGFPYIYTYTKNRCQIALHSNKETRCATEDEHMEIMVPGADASKFPAAVNNYIESSNWLINKIKNYNSKSGSTRIYHSLKKKNFYNGYYVYYACFMKPITKENIKSDDCIVILNNQEETRFATDEETAEINNRFGQYHL